MWGEPDQNHLEEMKDRFYEPVEILQDMIKRMRELVDSGPTLDELDALLLKVQFVADEATDAYWQSSSAYNC